MLTERTPAARKAAAIVGPGVTSRVQQRSIGRKTDVANAGNFRKFANEIEQCRAG